MYICIIMEINSAWTTREFVSLIGKSLAWEYHAGSHDAPVRHPEYWRTAPFLVVVCVVAGEYLFESAEAGRTVVRRGEVLLIPEGVRHSVGVPTAGVVHHHAHIDFSIFGSLDVLQYFSVPRIVRGTPAERISAATAGLAQIIEQSAEGIRAVAQAIQLNERAGALLAQIVSVSTPRREYNVLEIARLEPVLRYIEEHMGNPITRKSLAGRAGLSETHFHSVFKNALGMSPMAYVRSARMRRARALLMQSPLGIAEIGAAVGYPDIYHFSKTFKQAVGKSPRNYRSELLQRFSVQTHGKGLPAR